MTGREALLALAAAGFVAIFSALVVTAVIVLFGGRGAPERLADEPPGRAERGSGAVRVLRPDDPRCRAQERSDEKDGEAS